jgi:hypothetical protein
MAPIPKIALIFCVGWQSIGAEIETAIRDRGRGEYVTMKTHLLRVALVGIAGAVGIGTVAAQTASCRAELDKNGQARLEVIQRINAFQKKRPTAKVACGTFNELVAVEAKMLKWMDDNKEWCQLPDPFVEDFRKGTAQGVKARGQVCAAAKREAAGGGGGAAPRGPAPGSGIPLPKGAL